MLSRSPGGKSRATRPPARAPRRDWPDAIARQRYDDPARSLVMQRIGELVRDGIAEWRLLGNHDVELRLATGEVFLLSSRTITRIR
jgi:hypothetical protein